LKSTGHAYRIRVLFPIAVIQIASNAILCGCLALVYILLACESRSAQDFFGRGATAERDLNNPGIVKSAILDDSPDICTSTIGHQCGSFFFRKSFLGLSRGWASSSGGGEQHFAKFLVSLLRDSVWSNWGAGTESEIYGDLRVERHPSASIPESNINEWFIVSQVNPYPISLNGWSSRHLNYRLYHCSTGLVISRLCQTMSIASSDDYLVQRSKGHDRHKDGENCYPHGRLCRKPRRPIYGILVFLFGFALMKLAFYVADEPNPPPITRLLYFGIGGLSCFCIFHSVCLIFGVSVTQKHLTNHNLCNTVIGMANVLSADKQTAIIAALAEGSSIRSIERITGVHRDTIMRLGVKVGKGCEVLLDSKMQDLDCHYLQFDELWGFIGKKERHVGIDDDPEMGDVWTFCAIDSETKLVPSFLCGKRNHVTANAFVQDVASRMRNRVQISTDALNAYVEAVEQGFGADVDYGQIVKVYTHDAAQHPERKYSAPSFASAIRRPISGDPEREFISTSHVERLNATTRLHVKRLNRLTLAFSKKFENFKAAVALHFAYYNLVKRHNTLRCTPAMAAGIENDFWTVGQLLEATS
jgi:IS1 family transposase